MREGCNIVFTGWQQPEHKDGYIARMLCRTHWVEVEDFVPMKDIINMSLSRKKEYLDQKQKLMEESLDAYENERQNSTSFSST